MCALVKQHLLLFNYYYIYVVSMRDGLPTPLSIQFYLEEHDMRANNCGMLAFIVAQKSLLPFVLHKKKLISHFQNRFRIVFSE